MANFFNKELMRISRKRETTQKEIEEYEQTQYKRKEWYVIIENIKLHLISLIINKIYRERVGYI